MSYLSIVPKTCFHASAFAAASVATSYALRICPQSYLMTLGIAGVFGAIAYKAVKVLKIDFDQISALYFKNKFWKELDYDTQNVNRSFLNWIGPDGIQEGELFVCREFIHTILTRCKPYSSRQEDIDPNEIDQLIENLKNKYKGLCKVITLQFAENVKTSLKTFPKAKDVVSHFVDQKGRQGALLLQIAYGLAYSPNEIKEFLPESLVNLLKGRDSYDQRTINSTIRSIAEEIIFTYFPGFSFAYPEKGKKLTFVEFKKIIFSFDKKPLFFDICFSDKSSAHATYFYIDEQNKYYLFFDSNHLTHTSHDKEKFAKTVYDYFKITYPSWEFYQAL